MSDGFTVKSYKHTYQVRFETEFASILENEHYREGDVIVLDSQVKNLYQSRLAPILAGAKCYEVVPTEDKKSYAGLIPFFDYLIKSGFRKNNRLIAIGGGIVQDITAFAASVLFRGVDWIFYPTTLLAQCDSCIGSKTSINFGEFKNQVGGFYPPREIIIDTGFIATLSERDIRSGLGEMIHYFLVSGRSDFELVRDTYEDAFTDREALLRLIHRSLAIKRSYIERDEFDLGPRNVFNYGHSFGHAIESVTDYTVPHGIAICFGMDIANYISERRGLITDGLRMELRELLSKNWGNTRLPSFDLRVFANTLRKDKKAVGSEIRVILTKGLGQMFKTGLELDEEVSGWLNECFSGYQ